MRTLKALLKGTFSPPRQPDPFRKSRPEAKKLAAENGIEIEPMRPGFNVWPPKGLPEDLDEFAGDHYAEDWNDALERVRAYVAVVAPQPT